MPDSQTVLADANRLPVVDRIRLIEVLWGTVPDDCLPPLTDEWLAEIQRRSAKFVTAIDDFDQEMARTRQNAKLMALLSDRPNCHFPPLCECEP